MRIASFTLNISKPGGIEKICLLLAGHWAQKGHDSDIINFAGEGNPFAAIPSGVQIRDLGVRKDLSGWFAFLVANVRRITRLRHLFKSRIYDLVVCHGPIPVLAGG